MASERSASASTHGLPASRIRSALISKRRDSMRSAARSSMRARSSAGVARQAGNAAIPAATAASASAMVPRAQEPTIWEGWAGLTDGTYSRSAIFRPPITSGCFRPTRMLPAGPGRFGSPTAASAARCFSRLVAIVKSVLAAFLNTGGVFEGSVLPLSGFAFPASSSSTGLRRSCSLVASPVFLARRKPSFEVFSRRRRTR